MANLMNNVEKALNSSPLSNIGNRYMKYFKLGPLRSIASIGSKFLRQRRRNTWNRKDDTVDKFDHTNDQYEDTKEYDNNEYASYDYDPGVYEHHDTQPEVPYWDNWDNWD